jgi:acetyl-CoA carboxylase carboxyl transferase subunit beta
MPLFSKKNYSTVKVRKRDIPDGLWLKCPGCQEIIFKQELDNNLGVCPKCEYHFQMPRLARINMFLEADTFQEWDEDLYSVDTLSFTGTASYANKLDENMRKTGLPRRHQHRARENGPPRHWAGCHGLHLPGRQHGFGGGRKGHPLIEKCTAQRLPVILVAPRVARACTRACSA